MRLPADRVEALIREALHGADERTRTEAAAELLRHGVFVYPPSDDGIRQYTLTDAGIKA